MLNIIFLLSSYIGDENWMKTEKCKKLDEAHVELKLQNKNEGRQNTRGHNDG